MNVLLFEWMCGGGMYANQISPDNDCSFQSQGREMLTCLASDFLDHGSTLLVPLDDRIAGDTLESAELKSRRGIQTTPISRSTNLKTELQNLAQTADAIVIIAPESDSTLLNCCNWLSDWKEKFRSPDAEFVRLTSDKQATCVYMNQRGVKTPVGDLLSVDVGTWKTIEFPCVLKPVDGAGSENIRLIERRSELEEFLSNGNHSRWRIEKYVPGVPVSVSVICNGSSFRVLQPTMQTFKQQPFGEYAGAIRIDDRKLSDRARELATLAIRELPATRGYVGIDLVLADEGVDSDVVVEVNPRLTASYSLLRKLESTNLAAEMLG